MRKIIAVAALILGLAGAGAAVTAGPASAAPRVQAVYYHA